MDTKRNRERVAHSLYQVYNSIRREFVKEKELVKERDLGIERRSMNIIHMLKHL